MHAEKAKGGKVFGIQFDEMNVICQERENEHRKRTIFWKSGNGN